MKKTRKEKNNGRIAKYIENRIKIVFLKWPEQKKQKHESKTKVFITHANIAVENPDTCNN